MQAHTDVLMILILVWMVRDMCAHRITYHTHARTRARTIPQDWEGSLTTSHMSSLPTKNMSAAGPLLSIDA